MKNSLLALLALILIHSCSSVQSGDATAAKIKEVETNLPTVVYIKGDSTWTIEERMAHYGVPGVSIAVIHDGQIAWTKAYGIMDKETKSPVTEETLFQAASISKPVSAYGALSLVEKGKISLDTDINTYLKSWKLADNEFTKEKKVTLKNLLNHSAGTTVHGFLGYSPGLAVPTLVEVLNGTPPANSGAIFVDKLPEAGYRYSGGGYNIVQQMMIDVESKPFPEVMQELVLHPLEMNNSTFDQPLQGAQLNMAATAYLPDGSMVNGKRHTYPEMAPAGLWTTAEDLAKFAINIQKTLKGESEKGLSTAMTTKMLTPFVEDFIGLGIFINKKKEEIYFGHGGWNEGFSSELLAHKDKGYGVVVLTNSNHPPFISELIRSVALTYEWDNYLPVYDKMEIDAATLAEIRGRYLVNGNEIREVLLGPDQRLTIGGPGEEPTELVKISDSTYVTREYNNIIQFISDPENESTDMVIIDNNTGAKVSTLAKVDQEEKLPLEVLTDGDFEAALQTYQTLKNEDPDDPTVNEASINRAGYRLLGKSKTALALDVFKINTILYPNSANVFDSYAEAYMKLGDTALAIENYEKSLSLDPENRNAQYYIDELKKSK